MVSFETIDQSSLFPLHFVSYSNRVQLKIYISYAETGCHRSSNEHDLLCESQRESSLAGALQVLTKPLTAAATKTASGKVRPDTPKGRNPLVQTGYNGASSFTCQFYTPFTNVNFARPKAVVHLGTVYFCQVYSISFLHLTPNTQ